MICCVRPGVLLVKASRDRLASALIALDLPEFERPANAISGGPAGGSCSSLATVSRYSARWIGCANAGRMMGSRAMRWLWPSVAIPLQCDVFADRCRWRQALVAGARTLMPDAAFGESIDETHV